VSYVTKKVFLYINSAFFLINSFALKVKTVHSCETLKHSISTQCRNSKEAYHLVNTVTAGKQSVKRWA